MMEQPRFDIRIKDTYANEYHTLQWHEICNLTWRGSPPFTYEHATSTTQLGNDRFNVEIKKPKINPTLYTWPTRQQPKPPWSTINKPNAEL